MIRTIASFNQKQEDGTPKPSHFYIPAYQRGYRWTAQQVEDLLNDLNSFKPQSLPNSSEEETKYCLQPLIIKQREDGSYEVVDGQQRLTTIAIFMQIVKQIMPKSLTPFTMEYETRDKSQDFLEHMYEDKPADQREKEAAANIDFYHMEQAYQTMKSWLQQQEDADAATTEINKKIRVDTFFIWYEVPKDSNVIDLFNRVNMGKIPLTSAELIKALLFNQQNFQKDSITQEQTKMSLDWERIEHGLQDDSFWYFFNQKTAISTRMDALFDLLARDIQKNPHKYQQELESVSINIKKVFDSIKHANTDDPLFAFHLFTALLQPAKDKSKIIRMLWQAIDRLDALLHNWYHSATEYHLVGCLIAFGKPLDELINISFNQRKSVAEKNFYDKLKKDTLVKKFLDGEDISYNDNKKKLRNLLLLFNIATLVTKSNLKDSLLTKNDQQDEQDQQARFPFNLYKHYKWDIEHIHATKDESADADDDLGNLTLLDQETNRGWQNKPFSEKRTIILQKDKEGLFIPVCTKNIFVKAYTPNPKDLNDWYGDTGEEGFDPEHDDKNNYLKAMRGILHSFFKIDKQEQADAQPSA